MNKLKRVSLSSEDILSTVRTNLMVYRDIKKATSLKDILGPYKACVILYETTSDNHGHWCVIFEVNKNLIEFFDPYGYMIDSQLKYIDPKYKEKRGLNHTYLIDLLIKSDYNEIEWNNYPFQELKDGINTCGRHCITRLMYRKMRLDDYANMIEGSGMSADDFVTKETYFIE
jgi:hypothetical protein